MKSGSLIVMFVLGLVTGSGITYLYMDKKKDEAIEEEHRRLNEERREEKKEEQKSDDEALENSKKRFDEMMFIKQEHERQMKENGSAMVDYNKIVEETQEENVVVPEEALEENAEKNERIADAEEMANESMMPFTTDVDTFNDAFTNHTKDTAIYYIRDDTLIDSAGDIADADYLVGRANLDNFINGPYDEATNDTLYIINPSSGTDLEVQVIDDVSFDPASAEGEKV